MEEKPEDELYDEPEAGRRRDEVVKRMLATPPQPRPQKPKKATPNGPDDRNA